MGSRMIELAGLQRRRTIETLPLSVHLVCRVIGCSRVRVAMWFRLSSLYPRFFTELAQNQLAAHREQSNRALIPR